MILIIVTTLDHTLARSILGFSLLRVHVRALCAYVLKRMYTCDSADYSAFAQCLQCLVRILQGA